MIDITQPIFSVVDVLIIKVAADIIVLTIRAALRSRQTK